MTIEEYRKIISMAVGNEVAAYEFYRKVSDTTKDAALKKIFSEMAEEEKKHQQFLEGFLTKQRPMHFADVTDYKVSETVDKPKLSITMKPSDAIALAMKEEEEAMLMYQSLADCSSSPDQKEMFIGLSKMEKGHKAKLENMYTSMAFPEAW